jgi:hypothetical protein
LRFDSPSPARLAVRWPDNTDFGPPQILERFATTQPRKSQIGSSSPLADGAAPGKGKGSEASRLGLYADSRDRADLDSTSRLSCVLTRPMRLY